MQVWRAPCLSGHGTKPKSVQSGISMPRTRTPSCSSAPIDVVPGEAYYDGLLFDRDRASSAIFNHSAIHYEHTLTLVHHSCHSFQPTLPICLEGTRISQVYSRPSSFPTRPTTRTAASVVEVSIPSLPDEEHHTLYSPVKASSRALTRSLNTQPEMMTLALSVPGSPPDLTDSRSSKSSSSSNFSAPDESSTEITNFEDIGLEDENNRKGHVSQTKLSASVTTKLGAEARDAPYYIAPKPSTSHLRRTPSGSDHSGQRPIVGPLKRGLTGPVITNFSGQAAQQRLGSPPYRLPRSASTASLGAPNFAGPSPRSSVAPPSRRGSWQPRKTTKEIEAEYHDSDDELPDEASLWNVPISPFPSGNRSAFSSAKGSPERSSMPSPQPIPLDHARNSPGSLPRRHSGAQMVPRHRLTPQNSSNDLSQAEQSPPNLRSSFRTGRAKSWNVAMSDLSIEARVLSQNLEIHADSEDQTQDDKYKDKWLPPIPHRSSAPGAIQLPPIQRGPLDFMPISKEKEAILSRTRPSWLPPKDPKEEKKHLKEYQKMMAASIEAEKSRESKVKNAQAQKDDTLARINRIWDYYVAPTTDIVNIDRRVYDLCWRGIPSRVRGKVWRRTIGNTLGLSTKTYARALERAENLKTKDSQSLGQHERSLLKSFTDIERDAETAFPELKLFSRDGPMWQDLVNLCEAHTCYRSDIGYFYGVQLVGALMLLQVPDPAEAFVLMENCLNNPVPLAFHGGDLAQTQRTYNRVLSTLAIKFPRLHDYLFEPHERGGLNLTGEEVLGTVFRTMFANGLDVDRLCRVWDLWVFEGDRVLIRAAVALLGSLQSQIFDIQGDLHLRKRNVQEMLGWGPFNRTAKGSHWQLDCLGDEGAFIEEIRRAGQLDYTGQ